MTEKESPNDCTTTQMTTETEGSEDAATCKEQTTLHEELETAKAQAAEYLDGWQRARAEFANYKRRQAQEREEVHKLANATLLSRLLPVIDDFDRAFATLPTSLLSLTWTEGIALVHRKLEVALRAEGLTLVTVEPGQLFDPTVHEAVTHEAHDGFSEGQVIAEIQKGYKLGERVLRPTLVRVSSGSPTKVETESEDARSEDTGG